MKLFIPTAVLALGSLCCFSPGISHAQQRVDTWFESTEYTNRFLSLASQVGGLKVYTTPKAKQLCSRDNYLQGLLRTRIEWKDFQVSGERMICDAGSSRPDKEAVACFYPAKDRSQESLLRVSLGVWNAAGTDAERLKIVLPAMLEVCAPGGQDIEKASDELIESLRSYLRENDVEALDMLDSGHKALVHLPRSASSRGAFEEDGQGHSHLLYDHIQAGGGVTYSPSGGVSGIGSLQAHGIAGWPIGAEGGSGALTYLARGTIQGLDKPQYQLSLDGSFGYLQGGLSVWVGFQADSLKEWTAGETLLSLGIGAPPIFIRLGEKKYLLFQVAATGSNWNVPTTEKTGDSPTKFAYGGLASAIARLGDVFVTVSSHYSVHHEDHASPKRFDLNASVAIPLGYLLSNEFLRLELSHLAVSAGQVSDYDHPENPPFEVKSAHDDRVNLLYELRF